MADSAERGSPKPLTNRPGLWSVWDFGVHVAVGTLIFVVIAAAAFALDIINRSLQGFGVDPFIGYGLKVAEYAVFATDLLLFLVFLAKTGVRAARRF